MSAVYPRAYLDVNREPYELDPKMFAGRLPTYANVRSLRVAGGLGTIPRVVSDAANIYKAPAAGGGRARADRANLPALPRYIAAAPGADARRISAWRS